MKTRPTPREAWLNGKLIGKLVYDVRHQPFSAPIFILADGIPVEVTVAVNGQAQIRGA